MTTRPFVTAARPSTVGSATVPPAVGSASSAPPASLSCGDSSASTARSGHSTCNPPSIGESRSRASAMLATALRAAARAAHRGRELEPPGRQRHTGLHAVEIRDELLRIAELDTGARAVAVERDGAARLAHEIEQRARELVTPSSCSAGCNKGRSVARSKFWPDTTKLSSRRPRTSSCVHQRACDVCSKQRSRA